MWIISQIVIYKNEAEIWPWERLLILECHKLLDPVSWERKEIRVFILTPVYPHTYKYLCTYLSVSTVAQHDFPLSPALIQHHVDNPNLPHMLICNLSLRQWENWLAHLPPLYLIAEFQYTCAVVQGNYPVPLWKSILATRVQCLCLFASSLTLPLISPISLGQYLFPSPPAVRFLRTCVIQSDSFVKV